MAGGMVKLTHYQNEQRQTLSAYEGALASPWDEIAISYVLVINHISKDRPAVAFKEHSQLVSCVFCVAELEGNKILTDSAC